MENNLLMLFVAALVPMALGFAWYHPKLFGNAWMKSLGMTEEDLQGGNMAMIFGISYVLSLMLAGGLFGLTTIIHQTSVFSLIMTDVGGVEVTSPEAKATYDSIMAEYGTKYRTFTHGLFHGVFMGILIAFPVLATNSMFERKSWKNIWINSGYWVICIGLMSGIICAFV